MLACCVAANIWKKSYLPTDILEKNVICITFGQPLMGIAFVQEVIRMFPMFEKTIHSVFDKRDLVPRILRYFTVGCTQSRMSPLLPSAAAKPATVPEGQNVLVSCVDMPYVRGAGAGPAGPADQCSRQKVEIKAHVRGILIGLQWHRPLMRMWQLLPAPI